MQNPATLVVVDMQTAFRQPDSEWAVPGYETITPTIDDLTSAYAGRVVYTRFVRDPTEHGSWQDYYDRWSSMRQPADSAAWDLTLTPQDIDPVISLPTFSKWGTDLANTAGSKAPLVMCGVATDCCILATALAAADAGRSVTIVSDACAGATQQAHEESLRILELFAPMITVVQAAELAPHLQASAGTR